MSETQGLAAGCLLLIALFLYTFWPENAFASQTEKTRLDFLLERKEQLYENLRDLNFEYRAGKYPEEDFQAQRAQLENETAQLLAEMEHLQQRQAEESEDKDSGQTMKSMKTFLHAAVLSFLFGGALAQAAQLTGTVTNKTTGKPAAGDTVVLVEPMTGMTEVAHTTVDASGHYTLNRPTTHLHLCR